MLDTYSNSFFFISDINVEIIKTTIIYLAFQDIY